MSSPTNGTNVDHSTLHGAAKDVRSARGEVDGQLKKLRGVVEHDVMPQWKGTAATAFAGLMARWDTDAAKLLQSLGEIADIMDKSATHHQTNDEQQEQAISKIHSALSPGH